MNIFVTEKLQVQKLVTTERILKADSPEDRKVGICTIINKIVGDWYQWKFAFFILKKEFKIITQSSKYHH